MGRGDIARGGPESGLRALARLRAVGADPRAEIAALKERTGSRVAAYFDAYMPEEVLMAHGLLPYRVAVDGRDEVRATEHIQSYTCPAARNLLEQALRGDLGFVDVAVFTRYCDSLRGVYASWHASRLSPMVEFVRYPTVTNTEAGRAVPRRRVAGTLAAGWRPSSARPTSGRCARPSSPATASARWWPSLAARRADRSLPLMGADYLAVLLAATTMLPDEFTQELAALLAHPPAGEPGDAVPGGAGGHDLRQRGRWRRRSRARASTSPATTSPPGRAGGPSASTRPATRGWRWPGPT